MDTKLSLFIASERCENMVSLGEEARTYLISFSIPDYGVMFRCRIHNPTDDPLDLAFLSAVRFVEISLKNVKTKSMLVVTDSPSYYFANANGPTLPRRPRTAESLATYVKKFAVEFSLVSKAENAARNSTTALPHAPVDVAPVVAYKPNPNLGSGKMMPLQNGVEL